MSPMNNEAALRRYCAQVRKNLPCTKKQRKRVLDEVRGSAMQWLEQNPDAPFSEFEKTFGSPAAIAASHLEQMDTSELLKKLSVRKKILRIVLAVAAVVVLLWAGAVILALIRDNQRSNGYIEYYVTDEGTVSETIS